MVQNLEVNRLFSRSPDLMLAFRGLFRTHEFDTGCGVLRRSMAQWNVQICPLASIRDMSNKWCHMFFYHDKPDETSSSWSSLSKFMFLLLFPWHVRNKVCEVFHKDILVLAPQLLEEFCMDRETKHDHFFVECVSVWVRLCALQGSIHLPNLFVFVWRFHKNSIPNLFSKN